PLYSTGDTRSWTDLNHDGTVINPDGTPQYNEVGPPRNARFGTLAGTTQIDPNLHRDKNWDYDTTIQHTLWPRVSVSASYLHRRYFDLLYTNNTAVTFSDFIPITF